VNALPIYKYLIECLDEQFIKTYSFESGNFSVLRLHGGEIYKLNAANVADYWRQWKQETGHTSEDSTDICIVWRESFNVEKFFSTGKQAGVQTVAPTTWTSEDIENFFALTTRQLKSKLKISFDSTILIKTAQGQSFLVSSLDKPYPSSIKQKLPAQKKSEPSAPKKPSATSEEIAAAWKILTQKHNAI